MSDPLLDFLLTRNREKVMAEACKVSLEQLYAEATLEDRELIEAMPIGVLRRKLVEAETLLAAKTEPKVRVIGPQELINALRKTQAENAKLKRSNSELRRIVHNGNREAA